jgi:phosphohistidine phosphatase
MKTLYLMRHAKAVPANPLQPDRDRPLNERGLRQAAAMGKRLARRGVKPNALLSSPAARALATAEQLASALGIARKDIVLNEHLYNATPDDLLVVIQKLVPGPERLMLVGHNPGLAELANYFSREITNMPTASVVAFEFAVSSWAEIRMASPTQTLFEQPDKE